MWRPSGRSRRRGRGRWAAPGRPRGRLAGGGGGAGPGGPAVPAAVGDAADVDARGDRQGGRRERPLEALVGRQVQDPPEGRLAGRPAEERTTPGGQGPQSAGRSVV